MSVRSSVRECCDNNLRDEINCVLKNCSFS